MFEYIKETADPRTFKEILMTIWEDAKTTPGFDMRGLKEDINELMGRYGMLLEKCDNELLLARKEK